MRAVQLIGQTRHQLAQTIRRRRSIHVAQFQQPLDFARGQTFGQRTPLAVRLRDHDLVEDGFRRNSPGPIIFQLRRALTGQQNARSGPHLDPADRPGGDPHVHQFGQLIDQAGLDGLGASGVRTHDIGLGDVDVQLLDLFDQVIDAIHSAGQAAVRFFPRRLDFLGDAGGLVEHGLGLPDRILTQRPRGGVLGRGREGREDLVDLGEETGVRARIAELRLDVIIQFIAHGLTPGVGAGVQAGGLQETIGGQTNARHLHARANALAGPGLLVGDLADIAGRIDVRDVVGNHPQLLLRGVHARGGDVHDGVQGHQKRAPYRAAPGKPCWPARKSCPACRLAILANSLNLLDIGFSAPVRSLKAAQFAGHVVRRPVRPAKSVRARQEAPSETGLSRRATVINFFLIQQISRTEQLGPDLAQRLSNIPSAVGAAHPAKALSPLMSALSVMSMLVPTTSAGATAVSAETGADDSLFAGLVAAAAPSSKALSDDAEALDITRPDVAADTASLEAAPDAVPAWPPVALIASPLPVAPPAAPSADAEPAETGKTEAPASNSVLNVAASPTPVAPLAPILRPASEEAAPVVAPAADPKAQTKAASQSTATPAAPAPAVPALMTSSPDTAPAPVMEPPKVEPTAARPAAATPVVETPTSPAPRAQPAAPAVAPATVEPASVVVHGVQGASKPTIAAAPAEAAPVSAAPAVDAMVVSGVAPRINTATTPAPASHASAAPAAVPAAAPAKTDAPLVMTPSAPAAIAVVPAAPAADTPVQPAAQATQPIQVAVEAKASAAAAPVQASVPDAVSITVTPRPAAAVATQAAPGSQTAQPVEALDAPEQVLETVPAATADHAETEAETEAPPPATPAPARNGAARLDERRSNAAPVNTTTNVSTDARSDGVARSGGPAVAPTAVASSPTPPATAPNEAVAPVLPDAAAPLDAQVDLAPSQQVLDAQTAATNASRDLNPSQLSRATVETTAHLAAQILKKLEGRSTRFDMALTPEGLGRVDVSLEIDSDGRLAARLAFDNPAAATDMRARADELRRQLQDAGFQLAQDSLEFSERNPSSGFGGGAFERAPDRRAFAGAARLAAEADVALPSPGAWASLSMTPDRVDMKV
ncbi:Flagellar hook-length control protein FliK [compost metagenome]